MQEIAKELAPLGYEVGSLLSATGNTFLLRARQVNLLRDVAIKVLNPAAFQSTVSEQRFEQEAKLLASFEHPNIVKLYGVGKLADGRTYMVMELIQGSTLSEIAAQSQIKEAQIRNFALQICSALAYAHEKKIVHRDLKPANVMLHQSDSARPLIKLIDFGIYKNTDGAAQKLTVEGSIPGTANYMSPEQCRGEALDGRSDIYSLGCLLYELCCSAPPMDAETDWLIMSNHLNKEIKQVPATIEISEQLKNIILRCLQKDPAARWISAIELKSALEAKSVAGRVRTKYLLVGIAALAFVAISLIPLFALYEKNKHEVTENKQPVKPLDTLMLRLRYEPFLERFVSSDPEGQGKLAARQWLLYHIRDPRISIIELHRSWADAGAEKWRDSGLENDILKLATAERQKLRGEKDSLERSHYSERLFLAFDLQLRLQAALARWDEYKKTLAQFLDDPDIERDRYLDRSHILFSAFTSLRELGDLETAESLFKRFSPELKPMESKAQLYLAMGDIVHHKKSLAESKPYFLYAKKLFMDGKPSQDWVLLELLCVRLNMVGAQQDVCKLSIRYPISSTASRTETRHIVTQYLRAMMELGHYQDAEALMENPILKKQELEDRVLRYQIQGWRLQSAVNQNNKELVRQRLLLILDQPFETKLDHLGLNANIVEACERYPEFYKLCDEKLRVREPLLLAIIYAGKGHMERQRGELKESLHDYQLSQELFDRVPEFYHGRVTVYSGQVDTCFKMNDLDAAQKYIDAGKKYIPADSNIELRWEMERMSGALLRMRGRADEALKLHKELLEKVSKDNPRSAGIFNLVWEVYFDYKALRQDDAAVRVLESALPLIRSANIYTALEAKLIEDELKSINDSKIKK